MWLNFKGVSPGGGKAVLSPSFVWKDRRGGQWVGGRMGVVCIDVLWLGTVLYGVGYRSTYGVEIGSFDLQKGSVWESR